MASVYSTRFIAVQEAAGVHDYTVPDGKLAVIRCVTFWIALPVGAPRADVGIYDGVAFVSCANLFGDPLVSQSVAVDLRQVAYAGEIIRLSVESEDPDVMVSGYLLDLP